MAVYSFSQLGLYQQCPKKYQFRYLDGLEREFETTPDLLLGTSVHGALEWLYQEVNLFKKPEKSDLISRFFSLRDEGIQEAGETLHFKGDQSAEDYRRRGEVYLTQYFDQHSPFNKGKTVATELMLNFNLQNEQSGLPEMKFRGIIDRLEKDYDTFIINDYKTNKHLPTEDKDEYREQLTLYAQGILQKYGKYLQSIKARLHYLHFDIVDEWEITSNSLNLVLEKYKNLISQIENARFEYNMGVTEAFPTQQNPYCKYCEYQNLCPLFAHLNYGQEVVDGGVFGEKTVQKLVDRYVELSQSISEASKEKDQLKEMLVAYAEKKGFQQLFGEKNKIGITSSVTYSAKDKSELQKVLSELGLLEEVSDVPYYKLATLVKNKKLTPNQISTLLEQKPSWTLRASKRKEGEGLEDIDLRAKLRSK